MHKTILRWLLLCGSALFAAGCTKDAIDPKMQALLNKPAWVLGESTKYQENLYLMGHGVSADLEKAKQQSFDDLADAYGVQLQMYLNTGSAAAGTGSVTDANTMAAAQKELYNERIRNHQQIAETWQDPHSDAYHVLSIIDRVKAGKELAGEIYQIDQKIQRALEKSGQETDPLQRIAIANLATGNFQQRNVLHTAVKILLPTTVVAASDWSEEKIRAQISRWLSDVKIMPVLNQNNPRLLEALTAGVSKAGFIVDYGVGPDYILRASFAQGQIKWKDGVYSLDGNLRLELLDGRSKGQVRGEAQWPIEVTAAERDQLPEAVVKAVRSANEKKLKSTIMGFEAD